MNSTRDLGFPQDGDFPFSILDTANLPRALHQTLYQAATLGQLTVSKAGVNGPALTQAPTAYSPATQVHELVQAKFSAVDRGSLRLQSNEEFFCILSRHQASLGI